MHLFRFLLQYGVTDFRLLSTLTADNIFTALISKQEMEKYSAAKPADYYLGDQILTKQTTWGDIETCILKYDATNTDSLVAALLAEGDGNIPLAYRVMEKYQVLSITKLKQGLWQSAIYEHRRESYKINVTIANKSYQLSIFARSTIEKIPLSFPSYEAMIPEDFRRSIYGYENAGATDVQVIQEYDEHHSDTNLMEQYDLLWSALRVRNQQLVKYLLRKQKLRKFLLRYQRDIFMLNVAVLGDPLIYAQMAKLAGVEASEYAGSIAILMKYPLTDVDYVYVALRTAAYFADLDMIMYILETYTEVEVTKVLYALMQGVVAAGHSQLLEVLLRLIAYFPAEESYQELMELAYCFNNYHCMAVLLKNIEGLVKPSVAAEPNFIIANRSVPAFEPLPEYFAAWFDSFSNQV
jgi:hypothetical protein